MMLLFRLLYIFSAVIQWEQQAEFWFANKKQTISIATSSSKHIVSKNIQNLEMMSDLVNYVRLNREKTKTVL